MAGTFKRVADGIYRRGRYFYHRPKKPDGRYTWRALDARTLKSAKALFKQSSGQELDTALTISGAVSDYLSNDCPDKHRRVRTGKYLDQEKARCKTLLKFMPAVQCSEVNSRLLDDYADWRMKHTKGNRGGHGGRSADLDIVALKNVLRWVTRRGLLNRNPFETITVSSYRNPEIRHCREAAPRSGDELHNLAAAMFEGKRSATLGWMTLITAMVGCRVSEMTSLRTDAAEGEPGNITDGTLWLRRKKHGAYPFLKVHPDLAQCLDAFWKWRKERYKGRTSHWWFPGRDDPSKPVLEQSLTHALRRVGKLVANEARTAHGLRSFYVTVRRSQGASDAEIALETGHISGGREIVRTYGDATPRKLSWRPSDGQPDAWQIYEKYTRTKPDKPASKKLENIKPPRILRATPEIPRETDNAPR